MKKIFLLLALLISAPAAIAGAPPFLSCDQLPTTDDKPLRYRLSGFNPPPFNPLVPDGTVLYSASVTFNSENVMTNYGWQCSPGNMNVGGLGSAGPYQTLSTPLNGIGLRVKYTSGASGWWPLTIFTGAPSVQLSATQKLTLELVKVGPITAGGTLNGEIASQWYWSGQLKTFEYYIDNAPIKPLVPTCSLRNSLIPVSLNKVDMSRFKGIGSVSDDQPFNVGLSCAGGNAGTVTNVHATLTDATNPANRSDTLTLSPGSTALGVGIQVRKDGTTLRYGADSSAANNPNQWSAGSAANGPLDIALTARYVQTEAAVTPGSANGRATITMSYQ
ncbi:MULTISPECIES: fimbrial protein [Cupriavidus]